MDEPRDFMRLFLPLQGDLLAYILSMGVPAADADDVLQESASIMLRKFTSFQLGTSFRAWAFACVRLETLRCLKSNAQRPFSLSSESLRDIEYLAATESEVPTIHLKALGQCLQNLSASAASMLHMRYRDDLSIQEIAVQLQRPADSIYTALSRIRKSLHECIGRTERLSEEAR